MCARAIGARCGRVRWRRWIAEVSWSWRNVIRQAPESRLPENFRGAGPCAADFWAVAAGLGSSRACTRARAPMTPLHQLDDASFTLTE